jgi:hypothetical protein
MDYNHKTTYTNFKPLKQLNMSAFHASATPYPRASVSRLEGIMKPLGIKCNQLHLEAGIITFLETNTDGEVVPDDAVAIQNLYHEMETVIYEHIIISVSFYKKIQHKVEFEHEFQ